MKCPKCGKEIANDGKFCSFCGTEIVASQSKLPRWCMFALIIVMCIMGAIIGGLVSYYQRKLDATQQLIALQKMLLDKQTDETQSPVTCTAPIIALQLGSEYSYDKVSRETLLNQQTKLAVISSGVSYRIQSFIVNINGVEYSQSGNQFSPQCLEVLARLKKGAMIAVMDIIAISQDDQKTISLQSVPFVLD